MSHEIEIEGRHYISSKRASEISTYAQDYIGQLARKSLIDAHRVGGLWYVSLDSLNAYKKNADAFKPEPPRYTSTTDPDSVILLDGKEHISASKAAEITGYNVDYVGQLARSGTIRSQQVGNRWYIDKKNILEHKDSKDALLAAVQADSVGLPRGEKAPVNDPKYLVNNRDSGSLELLNYEKEQADLIPVIAQKENDVEVPVSIASENILNLGADNKNDTQEPGIIQSSKIIPIRVARAPSRASKSVARTIPRPAIKPRSTQNSSMTRTLFAGIATIVIVLSVGYTSLNVFKDHSAYAQAILGHATTPANLAASAQEAFSKIANLIEPFVTHQVDYLRPDGQ